VSYRPDAHLSKHHSSERCVFSSGPFTVSRSFCSSLHPSGRLSSPSGRLSVFDQASDSFQNYISEDCCNRPDDVDFRPNALFSLRQELQFKFNRSDVCQHGPDAAACSTDMEIADLTSTVRTPTFHGTDARTVNMEIACWRLTVRMTIPMVWTREALYGNYLKQTCDRPHDSVSPSGRGSQTGKIFSENIRNSGRTVVRSDGPCPPSRRGPYILQQSPI
jgi:hypothetical protein